METGIATVYAVGRISTERRPQPVKFDPDAFPRITSGQEVQFWRDPQDPEWAIRVIPAGTAWSGRRPLGPRAGSVDR